MHQKKILKFQTYNSVKRSFKLHILPFFKDKKIADLNTNDFLQWFEIIDNKNYCAHFKNWLRTKIVQMYDFLILYQNLAIENLPKKLYRFKDNKKKTCLIKIWSIRQCKNFLKASKKDIVYNTLFDFLLFNGCRISEALGLKFKDIEKSKVRIEFALSKDYINGKQILQSTKTNVERILYLNFKTRSKIKKLQKYYTKKYGYFNSDFFVFGGLENLKRTTIERKKNNYCKISNVPNIRIHDMRHTHATILYSITKNLKIVQEHLGHAAGSTTINTYIHVFDKQNKRTTRVLNILRLIF